MGRKGRMVVAQLKYDPRLDPEGFISTHSWPPPFTSVVSWLCFFLLVIIES